VIEDKMKAVYSLDLKFNNKAERFQEFLKDNGSADSNDWWGYSDVRMFSAHHPDLPVPVPYLLDEILPGETEPLPRQHDCKFKYRCKCFQPFNEVCYMVCSKNNQAFAIGNVCLKKLLPAEQRNKRCLTCKELYRGKYANCADCREIENAKTFHHRDLTHEERVKAAVQSAADRVQNGSFEAPKQALPYGRQTKPRMLKLNMSVAEICASCAPLYAEGYFHTQMKYERQDNLLRATADRVYADAQNYRAFNLIMDRQKKAEEKKLHRDIHKVLIPPVADDDSSHQFADMKAAAHTKKIVKPTFADLMEILRKKGRGMDLSASEEEDDKFGK
jgi:hypothetical protein